MHATNPASASWLHMPEANFLLLETLHSLQGPVSEPDDVSCMLEELWSRRKQADLNGSKFNCQGICTQRFPPDLCSGSEKQARLCDGEDIVSYG